MLKARGPRFREKYLLCINASVVKRKVIIPVVLRTSPSLLGLLHAALRENSAVGSVVSHSSTVSFAWLESSAQLCGPSANALTMYAIHRNTGHATTTQSVWFHPFFSSNNACVPMRLRDAQSETSSRKPYQKCVKRQSIVLIAEHAPARSYRTASGRQCNRRSIQVTKLTSHMTATRDEARFPPKKASQRGDQHRFTFPKILTIRIRQRIGLS